MKSLLLPKTRVILGALVGVVAAALTWGGVWDGLEDLTVDHRLRHRPPHAPSDEVRLVGIGDRDVGSPLGGWPFPRSAHADVLNILLAVGARHVVFDFLFTEASADGAQDARLKEAVEKVPQVTLAYHFEHAKLEPPEGGAVDRGHFIADASRHGLRVQDLDFVYGRLPVPPFAKLNASYGAANAEPDKDGVIRRVPLFFAHGGRLYPSLAMQTVIAALGLREDQISVNPGREVTLVDTPRGTLRIPIDEHGRYRVNFLGDISVFTPAFEYVDLYAAVSSKEMEARVREAIQDRIVMVGLASTGNADMVSAAVGRIAGVGVQATVVSAILAGDHLRFLPRWQQVLLVVLAGMLCGLCLWPARSWIGALLAVGLAALWWLVAVIVGKSSLMLPVVPVLVVVGVVTFVLLGLEAVAMRRDRTRLVGVLGRYIARPVLERLVHADQTAPATATERRELTIFFSDIRGFTAWTERAEPDEVAKRLNEYFAAMTPIVERHGGTLDKFIGDCVMVFFGAPVPDEKHALHAVRMALEMQQEMKSLNEGWRVRGYDPLHIGIGIHTGYVTVGSFGSASFLDYTVIGRAVNLAARIESQAEGGKILLSTRTQTLVQDEVKTLPHPDLVLKGIPEPQAVWEAVG